MYSLRKRSSVEKGMVVYDEFPSPTSVIKFVEYQPGNGTRYVLVITDLSCLTVDALKSIGTRTDRSTYLVTKVEGNPGVMTVGGSDFLHYSYVADKFKCSISDAVVLAELLGYLLNLKHVSCEEFTAKNGS